MLGLQMSRLVRLPSDTAADIAGTRHHLGTRIAVPMHAPAELVRAAADGVTCTTRMVWLEDEDAVFGIAIVHNSGHFAASVLDLGDARMPALAQEGLQTRRLVWLLQHQDRRVFIVPELTTPSRRMLRRSFNQQPAAFGHFARGVAGIAKALTERENYAPMGIDAGSLQSLTLSVCLPGQHESGIPDVQQGGGPKH